MSEMETQRVKRTIQNNRVKERQEKKNTIAYQERKDSDQKVQCVLPWPLGTDGNLFIVGTGALLSWREETQQFL